jgi:hypothetical protein
MSLFKELEKQGGRPGARIGCMKKCSNKKIPDIPDVKFRFDSDNLVYERPGGRVSYRPHPYYTDFDQLEADRIAKFGSKVRLDLDQPISDKRTIVQTEDGVSKSIATPTLREFLVSQLHQGRTAMSSNPAKTVNSLIDAIGKNGNVVDPSDVSKIKEVLTETIQNRVITKLDKQYITARYYKQYLAQVIVVLASNALVLRGGATDKLVISRNGNWVNEPEIRAMTDDSVLDVTNCQIVSRASVDPNEILDYIPTPVSPSVSASASSSVASSTPSSRPPAVPTAIPYTEDVVLEMAQLEADTKPDGDLAEILDSEYSDDMDLLASDIFEYGRTNNIPRERLIRSFITSMRLD